MRTQIFNLCSNFGISFFYNKFLKFDFGNFTQIKRSKQKSSLRFHVIWGLLLATMLNLIMNYDLKAQMDICGIPNNCTDIKVEMIKVHDNISPTCTTSTDQQCSNAFYQMAYKVYLRYTITDPGGSGPIGTIDLNYEKLDITVKLLNGSGNIFSKINEKATVNCFNASANGIYWNGYTPPTGQSANKPIFDVIDDKVVLTYFNGEGTTPDCGSTSTGGGNMITFDFDEQDPPRVQQCPQGKACAFVELFTVIVDAYPGEAISLDLDKATYKAKSSQNISCDFGLLNGGTYLASVPITIPNPGSYSGTVNERMELSLGTAVATNVSGQYEVPILLTNTGSQSVTVNYLEFLINADVADLLIPFDYAITSDPEIIEIINPSSTNFYSVTRKLLYKLKLAQAIIPGSGNAYTVGKIIVGPSAIANASWSVVFSLIDVNKARIKTTVSGSEACTNLKLKIDPLYQVVSMGGDGLCTEYSIRFYSRLIPKDNYCNDFNLYIGLKTLNSNELRLAGFKVQLQINDPGVTFGNIVDFGQSSSPQAWPYDCTGLSNSCGPGCYSFSQNNTQFQYCFEVTNPNDVVVFFDDDVNYFKIPVSIPDGICLNDLTVETLRVKYYDQYSVPHYCLPYPDETLGVPQCPNFGISGKLETEEGEGLENATVTITPSDGVNCTSECQEELITNTGDPGAFGFCDICIDCEKLKIEPMMELDPLNGVNTYDLILISRHILGLEPLNSPYKLINADATKTGTITTFDVVELRKLILGTYTELPNNSSWRFVDKSQVFANPSNPFAEVIKENIIVSTAEIATKGANNNFVACKIGDVDYTASANQKSALPTAALNWELPVKDSKLVTLPIYYNGNNPVIGLQFAFHFDPGQFTFVSVSNGAIGSLNDLNFSFRNVDEGRISFSWNTMDLMQTPVQPGEVLFYLTFVQNQSGLFKVKSPVTLLEEDEKISPLAWQVNGDAYRLINSGTNLNMRENNDPSDSNIAEIIPNPTEGVNTILFLQASERGNATLVILNTLGQQLSSQDFSVSEGINNLPLNGADGLPKGLYNWSLRLATGHILIGSFIKQ